MSKEDRFLDAITADRTDRMRVLVFADWLADRSDPREEFVRLHARLLDIDGSEQGFESLDRKWAEWTSGIPLIPGYLPGPTHSPRLPERWIDSLCRLFTAAEVAALSLPYAASESDEDDVERQEFGQMDHIHTSGEESLAFYRGPVSAFRGPLDFISRTVLRDLWDNPFSPRTPTSGTSAFLHPISRGSFWQRWRLHCGGLRNPPQLPALNPDNPFVAGQFIAGDWNNWALVAAHRDDYFALFWSTTA